MKSLYISSFSSSILFFPPSLTTLQGVFFSVYLRSHLLFWTNLECNFSPFSLTSQQSLFLLSSRITLTFLLASAMFFKQFVLVPATFNATNCRLSRHYFQFFFFLFSFFNFFIIFRPWQRYKLSRTVADFQPFLQRHLHWIPRRAGIIASGGGRAEDGVKVRVLPKAQSKSFWRQYF